MGFLKPLMFHVPSSYHSPNVCPCLLRSTLVSRSQRNSYPLSELPHPCVCPAPWMEAELCWELGMQRCSDLPVQGERHLHPHPLLQDDAAAASCGSRDSRWAKHSAQEGGKALGEGAPCCGGSWAEEPQMPMDT